MMARVVLFLRATSEATASTATALRASLLVSSIQASTNRSFKGEYPYYTISDLKPDTLETSGSEAHRT